ncbi:MAG: hypothetical protein ABI222_15235, partial [Opitutaceae bacterium]
GRAIPTLGLVITGFTVEHRSVPLGESMSSIQKVAQAEVRDEQTGQVIALKAGELSLTDELSAVLTTDDDVESPRELRTGEEFSSADYTYRVERLQLEPPSVDLTQIDSDSSAPVRVSLSTKASSHPLSAESAD